MRRLLVIGGGPIGIETALSFARGGNYHVTVAERAPNFAANVAAWGHVKLFSPWRLNMSPGGIAVLTASGVAIPERAAFPTGAQLRSQYLVHIWAWLEQSEACSLLPATTVVGVTRGRKLKYDMSGRTAQPFRALILCDGVESVSEFDAVIDCSGSYGNANALGVGGLAAIGERALQRCVFFRLII